MPHYEVPPDPAVVLYHKAEAAFYEAAALRNRFYGERFGPNLKRIRRLAGLAAFYIGFHHDSDVWPEPQLVAAAQEMRRLHVSDENTMAADFRPSWRPEELGTMPPDIEKSSLNR